MHSPFSLAELIPPSALGKDPITALVLHANRVIAGTDKGALLVFDLSTASTSSTPPTASFVSRHDGFAKKSIEQLGVIKELNAILCLSAGDLTLHSLPSFELLSSFASQTRAAASLFVLYTQIRYPSSETPRRSNSASRGGGGGGANGGAPEIHSTLAIACKRRLVLFGWIDGSWTQPRELSLPHQIRGMAFGESSPSSSAKGTKRIVAGFSTGEYGIITLPVLSNQPTVKGDPDPPAPTLGELFTPPIPNAVASAAIATASASASAGGISAGSTLSSYGERFSKATGSGLIGLGGLAKATGLGALANFSLVGGKVDKNDVVAISRAPGSGKGKVEANANGNKRESSGEGLTAWLWGKEWGWPERKADEEDEVLLVRENISLAFTVSGKLRSTGVPTATPSKSIFQAVVHPAPVEETIVLSPYIFSLMPSTVSSAEGIPAPPSLEIHSIDSLRPVQSLEISLSRPSPSTPSSDTPAAVSSSTSSQQQIISARLLSASSSSSQPPLVVLTSTPSTPTVPGEQTLWIATMRSWESQIEELGQKGEWEEGIRLMRRSGTGGADLPARLLQRLGKLHALALFNEKRYDFAIDAFISFDVSPAKVVALFPEPISGKLFVEEAIKEELFGGRGREKVLESLEEKRREDEVNEEIEEEAASGSAPSGSPAGASPRKGKAVDDDDTASVRSGSTATGRLRGSKSWIKENAKLGEDPSDGTAEKAALAQQRQAKVDAQNYLKSVDALIRYLTDRRQHYAQALAAFAPSVRPKPSASHWGMSATELFDLPDLPLTELKPEQLAQVAQVVDTALFRSYLATKPVMMGPLCRIENWCEVGEVEELLLKAKKYKELLDLYNGKNMHSKAVTLLRQMSHEEEDPEEKLGPTIRYLQKLGSEHLELIFESSRWIFDISQEAGLEIFIADLEEVESLPRYPTMQHLDRIAPAVCARYLEHIIHQLGEEAPEFHEKLIELYLDFVHKKSPEADESYQKLLELLETSISYRADRILGRLPSEDMYQVRAILLGRLGRHEGALQLYVYQLEDHATAEEYCKRVYDSDPNMRSTIFHILLRIYLRPRQNHPLLFGPALALMSNHASSIDAVEVFELLPPLVALGDIKVFLEKTLRRSGERVREAKVVKGIGKSWVEAEAREVVSLEERRVKITDSRVCPQCNKRLGNSVIAIHSPHGEVTHYGCRDFKSY
ncbi:hypothetical protein T439DRAFT_299856 [Meredithblackwellia eburnea MCA 4105]